MNPAIGDTVALERTASWPAVTRHLLLLGQLALAAVVVRLYAIEGPAFFRLFILATAGFAINLVLPLKYRLPFFLGLSLAGAWVMLGAVDAAWLAGCGLALIGICHLPWSMPVRVGALLCAGSALAIARAGLAPVPWSAAVWPILGSMFMFRLALYLWAMKNGKVEHSLTAALAYFFMFPNLAFPLFPVIDYQTFRRTYYDRQDTAIYEQGLVWISRGLMHLLLYRFVYHAVLNDPVDVVSLGDLVQFMVGTFLLYLRVSGQFHLVVGLLHLFGFRLPETHKLYYLAHSFTELWRRINIYWTDFMMKVVFYPTYFKVKKLGPTWALVVSTTTVFLVTWVLHSYQWFWLRGGFPLTLQDTLFWGILGALVVRGGVKELQAAKKSRARVKGWSWRHGLRAAVTFASFCFLWSLWSTESVTQWVWMFGAVAEVDAKGVVLLAATLGAVFALGGRDWDAPSTAPRPRWLAVMLAPPARTLAALALLLVAAQPAVQGAVPNAVASGLHAMQMTGLNARDAAVQHRGYYEQLELRGQPSSQVFDVVARGDQWDDLASIGMLRERKDILLRDLHPSRSALWNGKSFSTNRWGMRDRDYPKEKAPGTLRVALLGPSHVMGNGVADGATFEALVEERLNREFTRGPYARIEILNFGVDGYALPQQVAILEERVLAFAPDVVVATHYQRNRFMTERYLQKVVWGGVTVPDPALQALLADAGLMNIDRGEVPVPFAPARAIAKGLGISTRMPDGESAARIRRIADRVLELSFRRFAEITRANGVVPLVVGLNAVIDDVPAEIPNLDVIHETGVAVIDLFDVFPEPERPALRVAPWDDHPNAEGHRRIADRLYPEMAAFLETVQSQERRR
jgi:D-alanyl-lipoteichoic acid acyltransferase DltB (MBOAT superfamily)